MLACSLALVALAASYCALHARLSHQSVATWISFSWAAVTVCPWYLAFEFTKRLARSEQRGFASIGHASGLLTLAWVVSTSMEQVVALMAYGETTGHFSVQLLSRLPLLMFAVLAAALLMHAQGTPHARRRLRPSADMQAASLSATPPLRPFEGVDLTSVRWIGAAGNYVELHGPGRPQLLRMTMAQAECALAPAHWVRVHRSTLARLEAIERVEREDGRIVAVVLQGGWAIKVGRHYVAGLTRALAQHR
jgi:DNA-binding LytR/AlgR family response regulator